MQFYDDTTKQGICQEIDRLCDSDDTSYTRLAKTSRVNTSLEELVGDIINADGTWQYDDTNYSTTPFGTGTLISGQISYSFASEYLQIEEISILDVNGYFRKLTPFDSSEVGMTFEEYFNITYNGTTYTAVAGLSTHYDKFGDTIVLSNSPTATYVTLSKGLKVKFKRTAQLFTAVSTTAADTTEPGLPSTHHVILAYMASIPYCMTYKKDRVDQYRRVVGSTDPTSPYYGGMKKSLIKAYSTREKDKKNVITMQQISFR